MNSRLMFQGLYDHLIVSQQDHDCVSDFNYYDHEIQVPLPFSSSVQSTVISYWSEK